MSATFVSPSHSFIFSLIQEEASIAAIITPKFCGSHKVFLNCPISSRIQSNTSNPDFVGWHVLMLLSMFDWATSDQSRWPDRFRFAYENPPAKSLCCFNRDPVLSHQWVTVQ
jgi:hypothetical protein